MSDMIHCIFCKEEILRTSDEHVIPDCLLCNPDRDLILKDYVCLECNNTFGRTIDADFVDSTHIKYLRIVHGAYLNDDKPRDAGGKQAEYGFGDGHCICTPPRDIRSSTSPVTCGYIGRRTASLNRIPGQFTRELTLSDAFFRTAFSSPRSRKDSRQAACPRLCGHDSSTEEPHGYASVRAPKHGTGAVGIRWRSLRLL